MGFTVKLNVEVSCDEHPHTGSYSNRSVRVELPLDSSTRDREAYEELKTLLGENVAEQVRCCARVIREASRPVPEPRKVREASQGMARAKERLRSLPSRRYGPPR